MSVIPAAVDVAKPAPEGLTRRTLAFAAIVGQLLLLLAVIHLFEIESQRYFLPVMGLASAGFMVHAWLPARFRLAFFCLLSVGVLVVYLGWEDAGWLLGIGLGLIGLCHLPIPMLVRVLLLMFVGVWLAACRVEFPAPFWPVLGSMFMFRLMVYLYDLGHDKTRPDAWSTIAYFFPLPNVCFPLFPVLDFKTFRQSQSERSDWLMYQTGVEWLLRGLVHLLLYRYVKYFLVPSPHEIRDWGDVVVFLAANYALYLRVSGWFHVITGMLYLFGFQLPRTHWNYFLASSFTDVWRRINIYWKDFMAKLFFLPAFFTLRSLGTRFALALAALWVFLATWLLHSYQHFWLVGELPLTLSDAFLWLTVGVVVVVNLQWDVRRAARPQRSPSVWTFAGLSLRIAGMFLLVSFFWACWTLPGFLVKLQALWSSSAGFSTSGVVILAGIVGLAVAAAILRLWGPQWSEHWSKATRGPASILPSAILQTGVLVVLVVAGLPGTEDRLPAVLAERLAVLRREAVTPLEARHIVRGYYEELTDAPVQASAFMGLLGGKDRPPPPGAHYSKITRPVDDLLERELIPGWSGELAGSRLTINRFGMRDRDDLTLEKPPGTYRIALVGSSVVMGYGVVEDEVFGRLLENRLNADPAAKGRRYQVLNFGTGMSFAIHRRVLIDRKVWGFAPDAIFYVAHQDELLGPPKHLAKLVAKKNPLPYRCLEEAVRQAGIEPDTSWGMAESLLQPHARTIVAGIYRDLVAECRKRGVVPVWIYLPMPGVVEVTVKSSEIVALARASGFSVVNLADWAEGRRPADVKLGPQDHHANALGHRLIAERLHALILRRPELWHARE